MEPPSAYQTWVDIIRAVTISMPLACLWALNSEAPDAPTMCAGPDVHFNETGEPLAEDEKCEEAPTWIALLPIENEGAYELPLCARHLAILVLHQEEGTT